MKAQVIEAYIERIYGYAIKRTYSREEADELSQEILCALVKGLPKLREENKFEPWLWGVADNVTKTFRRFMGKQRAMYSYDSLETLDGMDDPTDDRENEVLYGQLRGKIARLSEIYRNILLLHYYDGLSTKQISEKLGVPEGTVTWRLSEARKKLKAECDTMNETALRPVELQIRISGSGNYNGTTVPFPYVYINDALSQNILYHCYEAPKSVTELANLCGVPAYYIEDRLANLVRREAMSEKPKGKYRTDFILYSDKIAAYSEKAAGIFNPVSESFASAMEALTKAVESLGIDTAGKPREELIYLYGVLALEHLSEKHNPVEYSEIPVRYDGCRWSYHAHIQNETTYPVRGLGREWSQNLGSEGRYQHLSYHFGGFSYRRMMLVDEINVCEAILTHREITDTDSAAAAIAGGYITRQANGDLSVAVPSFTKTQYTEFKRLADTYFADTIASYSQAVAAYVAGYKKLFPPHLEADVSRACHYLFLTLYATVLCDTLKATGRLVPPKPDSVCDVLIQFK